MSAREFKKKQKKKKGTTTLTNSTEGSNPRLDMFSIAGTDLGPDLGNVKANLAAARRFLSMNYANCHERRPARWGNALPGVRF